MCRRRLVTAGFSGNGGFYLKRYHDLKRHFSHRFLNPHLQHLPFSRRISNHLRLGSAASQWIDPADDCRHSLTDDFDAAMKRYQGSTPNLNLHL